MNDTTGAAAREPMAVPALKMPTASARSFIGNHSLTARTPPVKLPGSNAPSSSRKNENCPTVVASTCNMFATDQPVTNTTKPLRVPITSITRPLTAYMTP